MIGNKSSVVAEMAAQLPIGSTYDVHLGLIRKRIVDFLLVLIELFR